VIETCQKQTAGSTNVYLILCVDNKFSYHQKYVSVHDVAVSSRDSLDLSFLDELASWTDDIKLTVQTLIDVDELAELFLHTSAAASLHSASRQLAVMILTHSLTHSLSVTSHSVKTTSSNDTQTITHSINSSTSNLSCSWLNG